MMAPPSDTYAACRHPSDAAPAFTSTLKRELPLSQTDEAKIDVERLSQAARHLHREPKSHELTGEETKMTRRGSSGGRKAGLCPAL